MIEKMAAGDREAFRLFAETYSRYLFQTAYSILHSTKDAEDVTQEVLLKIFSSLPQYRHQGFKTWITRIAVNKAIDFKRSRDRKREDLLEQPELCVVATGEGWSNPVEESVLKKQEKNELLDRIDQLPEGYKKVVVAFYMEDKSYQQISEEQQIDLHTVKSKLYRAKKYMKKHWKEEKRE